MKRNEQGIVYPFRLSGSRMRQSAVQLRRQGQALDALTLIRRAAEQEDTPSAWQALAAELRQVGCWEAAAQVMGRVLSMPGRQPSAWLEMARCLQALGHNAMALDCVYHLLQEDPWSAEADAGRAMLDDLEPEEEGRTPRRLTLMISRGMRAWSDGDREAGERRIRRAIRLSPEPTKLLSTAAMMCMLSQDFDGAERYLTRALQYSPEDSRTLTALSTLRSQQGEREQALALLAKAAEACDGVLAEDSFLTAAWAQDAWKALQSFLDARMKRYPYRIALLSAKATMCHEMGDVSQALQLWRDILAIDPDDRQAAARLAAAQTEDGLRFVAPGMLPPREKRAQQAELRALTEGTAPVEELLRHGSRSRRLIDWGLCSPDEQENRLAAQLLTRDDASAAIPFLREMVARPFLRMDARQWALLRLAEMGSLEELIMPAGSHYTLVQCQKISEKRQRSLWLSVFPSLLSETRRYRQSREILEFAAALWRGMSLAQREAAAGSRRFVWCKAVEVLYLRAHGEEALAARVVRSTPLSHRRITRILRSLVKTLHGLTD